MDLNWKILTVAAVVALGAALLTYGVAVVYEPAGFIVGGLLLIAFGLLPDWGA